MVHGQHVDESRLRRNSREAKKASSFESGSSKGRLDIKDKPRFKKRYYNQVSSKFQKGRYDGVSNPKSPKGRGTSSPRMKPLVDSVAKKITVNYLLRHIIALSMERMPTRLWINYI